MFPGSSPPRERFNKLTDINILSEKFLQRKEWGDLSLYFVPKHFLFNKFNVRIGEGIAAYLVDGAVGFNL